MNNKATKQIRLLFDEIATHNFTGGFSNYSGAILFITTILMIYLNADKSYLIYTRNTDTFLYFENFKEIELETLIIALTELLEKLPPKSPHSPLSSGLNPTNTRLL